jgi:hypothetical protein
MPTVANLFLSSTVRDLEDYRRAVRDACLHKAETACLLSEEDWSGGYDDTVAKCISRVKTADAFVLIIGHWYGSIPPGHDRSITHIEFETAVANWQAKDYPPLAVMMPAQRSAADIKLRKAAQKILRQEKIRSAAHKQSLNTFIQAVTSSWRTVTRFKHSSDLREHVIAKCWEWKGRTPMAAARGEITVHVAPVAARLTDEQLGSLGRASQFAEVKAMLAKVVDYQAVPAVSFLVYGDDSAGQRVFLQRLANTALKKHYPRRGIAALPVRCDVSSLPGWIAQLLAVADGAAVQSPRQLAERVATELKRQPLYFVLDRIGDLPGGAAAFHEGFWRPFYEALAELRATRQFAHRLVALVSEYVDAPSEWQGFTFKHDPKVTQPDYSRLVQLPRLDHFERDDLLAWFDDMDVPDEPAGQRAALADRAMRDSKGVPLRVFERLRGETLWPAGEEP